MKKKIIFIVSLLLALSIPSVAYAEEYGNTYPAYVPVSGGAYIEVQCALGRGTLVFAREYKDGYFGFYGSGYSPANISRSTISGTYYTAAGVKYNARVNAMGEAQYYRETSTRYEWTNLNVTKIYNTNVKFEDFKDDRANIIDLFSYDPVTYLWLACTVVIILLLMYIAWRSSCDEYFTKLIGECPSYLYGVVYVLSFFLVVFGLYVILTLIKVFFFLFFKG